MKWRIINYDATFSLNIKVLVTLRNIAIPSRIGIGGEVIATIMFPLIANI